MADLLFTQEVADLFQAWSNLDRRWNGSIEQADGEASTDTKSRRDLLKLASDFRSKRQRILRVLAHAWNQREHYALNTYLAENLVSFISYVHSKPTVDLLPSDKMRGKREARFKGDYEAWLGQIREQKNLSDSLRKDLENATWVDLANCIATEAAHHWVEKRSWQERRLEEISESRIIQTTDFPINLVWDELDPREERELSKATEDRLFFPIFPELESPLNSARGEYHLEVYLLQLFQKWFHRYSEVPEDLRSHNTLPLRKPSHVTPYGHTVVLVGTSLKSLIRKLRESDTHTHNVIFRIAVDQLIAETSEGKNDLQDFVDRSRPE